MARQQPRNPHPADPPHALPLPGSRGSGGVGVPDGMHQYVVNLVPPDVPETPPGGRRSVTVNPVTEVAVAFVARARAELAKRGLENQVDGFGEAYGVPVVTLTATPAVAEVLRQIPGVEAVYQDDAGSLGLT